MGLPCVTRKEPVYQFSNSYNTIHDCIFIYSSHSLQNVSVVNCNHHCGSATITQKGKIELSPVLYIYNVHIQITCGWNIWMINNHSNIHATLYIYVRIILTNFKRNITQKYTDKSRFLYTAKIQEVILPMKTKEFKKIKRVISNDSNVQQVWSRQITRIYKTIRNMCMTTLETCLYRVIPVLVLYILPVHYNMFILTTSIYHYLVYQQNYEFYFNCKGQASISALPFYAAIALPTDGCN